MVFKTKGLFFQEGDPFGVSNATMIFGVPQAKADLDAAGENLIATAKTMHHLEEELALAGAPYFSSLICAIEEHDHISARRYRKSILNVRPSQSPFCRTGVGEVVSHAIMWGLRTSETRHEGHVGGVQDNRLHQRPGGRSKHPQRTRARPAGGPVPTWSNPVLPPTISNPLGLVTQHPVHPTRPLSAPRSPIPRSPNTFNQHLLRPTPLHPHLRLNDIGPQVGTRPSPVVASFSSSSCNRSRCLTGICSFLLACGLTRLVPLVVEDPQPVSRLRIARLAHHCPFRFSSEAHQHSSTLPTPRSWNAQWGKPAPSTE